MKSLIIMILGVIGMMILQGCTTVGCLAVNEGAAVATNYVGGILQCTGTDLMDSDLTAYLESHTGICPANKKNAVGGPVANILCPEVAMGVVGFVQSEGAGFLTKYGCTAANASSVTIAALTSFCEQLPLAPKPKH